MLPCNGSTTTTPYKMLVIKSCYTFQGVCECVRACVVVVFFIINYPRFYCLFACFLGFFLGRGCRESWAKFL